MCGLCGSVNAARVLVHSSNQAGEGLGTRLCILFASNSACCQDYAVCHFLRLIQSFQSLVTSSCSWSIWTLYRLRQLSRSRLGPRFVLHGWPPQETIGGVQHSWRRKELSVLDGCVLWGEEWLYIPPSGRE